LSLSKIGRALISVSDKTGCVDFATRLQALGVEVLSTGGTAQLLTQNGVDVTGVSTYTGFPEMLDGRVKTLHPKIHGGILARRGIDEDVISEHNILPIDLVVVNLYPFERTIEDPKCELADAIENIDIGGPTLLRAAAKNYVSVTTVVDNADYGTVISELESHGGVSDTTRFSLALKAFSHTARYDGAIANYLSSIHRGGNGRSPFPHSLNLQFHKIDDMRYGENPHQRAAFYRDQVPEEGSIAAAEIIQGKAMSYNNVVDADAALECVHAFERTACVIVKHANPCGVAVAPTALQAYEGAYQTDPTSAFGGIIAFNSAVDAATAKLIIERQFVEVIIAPYIDEPARAVIANKKNIRVLQTGFPVTDSVTESLDYKRVSGGVLVQQHDYGTVNRGDLTVVTERHPSDQEISDLLFAWKVVKFVKSNAIVYARGHQTIGIGAGQMSRVYSAKIAGLKAQQEGLEVKGSVMASDAFFPFRDGIDSVHSMGISAVIQPGGSARDEEIIGAANEHGMSMVFTGMRHFRH